MTKRPALNGVLLCAVSVACFCQPRPPHYVIGVDLVGPNSSCPDAPIFISSVRRISPASSVGIKGGDQLVAIDGNRVKDLRDATHRLTSDSPQSVVLDLKRGHTLRRVTVRREESDVVWMKNGFRLLDDGLVVGSDYSTAEIDEERRVERDLMQAMRSGVMGAVLNVFPGHYPADKRLYYPGFEVFVWDQGDQVRVGGIENGPAKKSGMRWGERILSVNGVDPRKKSLAELESLLSSPIPAPMKVTVERAGARRSFSFQLEMAAVVLRHNNWQIVDGQMVPLWVPKAYTSCFK